MPLDADAGAVLQAMSAQPWPDPSTLDLATFRAGMSVPMSQNPVVELPLVKNLTINSGRHSIGARLYKPTDAALLPVLVFYHGGGWVLCNLETHDELCRRLAKASGWAILSVEYRLAPEARFPDPFEDCYSALGWVSAYGKEHGLDGRRMAVGGDSAGGNLAAAVALAARDRGGPRLTHQLLIYPVTDRSFDTVSYKENGKDYGLSTAMMQWFWDQYLANPTDAQNPLAAPLQARDVGDLPPATVITAEFDPLRDEGEAYGKRLASANPASIVQRVDGVFHGFASMFGMIGKADSTLELMAERLRAAAA